ncbi:dihydrodipicolinate synthase family protein [Halomicrococcus sp. NG-SE-24]|uniref:dihydrodipicolinate synthase family protein n=1 Tax=Halomicrococcus sp. NG-SE-24 TaxID=3436928 RepID=UPI003D95F19D
MDLSGTVVPMATPTDRRSGEIDVSALERFTDSLVQSGVHGLFPGSSIGEFSSLTTEQNRTVIETVAAVADDRVPVFAGCGHTSVDAVVENVQTAAAADADVAVVVTPYYLSTTQNGLDGFFTDVADRSPIPVVLYNIPQLTGNAIEIETVTSLADHRNVVGLKDTSGDLTYHHRVNERTAEEFAVFQGATELAAASLELGSDGIIAGPANVFPEHLARLYEAFESNDHDVVSHIMERIVAPAVSATNDLPTAAAVKHLVAVHEMDIGDPLPPLPTLTESERARLEQSYGRIVDAAENELVEQ